MLGTLLHERYNLIQELGSGGFGQTYIAIDQQTRQHCVVKQLKPTRQDPKFLDIARRLFKTEVATLRKLGSHDQIPALLDDFEENQEFYLVQEYVDGEPLNQILLDADVWTEAAVQHLLDDVLQVLDFVHQNQVIHRDVKPSNIMRRRHDGKFVLIDFGAVKEIQTQITAADGQTHYTVGISTHGYGPSEQVMGKPRYNSDIYALGMTAIQALTGLQPTQLPTHPDTGEVIWQDRAIASPKLCAILDKMVRYHFTQRYPSVAAVQQAIAATFIPTASTHVPETQLPITQLPAAQTTQAQARTMSQAGPQAPGTADTTNTDTTNTLLMVRRRRPWLTVSLTSVIVTSLVWGLRQIGGFQSLELTLWDRMVQLSPDPGPDPRLLIVGITDADIAAQKQFPLSDRVVAQALQTLQKHQPRAIGLALLRDVPLEPGHTKLQTILHPPAPTPATAADAAALPSSAAPIIAIVNNFTNPTATKTPPLGLPLERIGFNDFVLDRDGVLRRNLLFADVQLEQGQTTTVFSFALQLAIAALKPQGISITNNPADPNSIQLGKATLHPLESNAGNYQALDARGYQILMQYRGRNVAHQVSLTDLLQGHVNPDLIKDKIVLLGTTAVSGRDLFLTPYSAIEQETPRMPGVVVYGHMLSQLLSAAQDGRSLLWVWSDSIELLWIFTWAVAAGWLVQWQPRPWLPLLTTVLGLSLLGSIGFGLFIQQGWVPIVAPAIAFIATSVAASRVPSALPPRKT